MERRRFLAAVATSPLLAGCSDGPGEETATATPVGGTETPSPTPGDAPGDPPVTAEDLRERRLVEFETAPLTVAVYGGRTINGRLRTFYGVSEPATEASPAVVHALLRNGNDFEQTFRLRRVPGFGDPPFADREDGEATVYLAPTEGHELATSVPDVERDDDGRWRLASSYSGRFDEWLPETATLGPQEAALGEYHLVSDAAGGTGESVAPFGVGDYRFRYRGEGFTVSVWETGAPGPTEGSEHAGADVPRLPGSGAPAWFHEADAATEVYLRPSAERLEAPACVEFELVNRSHERVEGNPYDWRLYKLVDGEWFPVAPWTVPAPLSHVAPGERRESELGVYHGDPLECEDGRAVGHLGGGRYAYRVGFGRVNEAPAALFDLEAPPVDPAVDDDATVERDGEAVVVTMPEWHDEDRPPRAELVFERAGGDPDRRLIPEQLFRRPMRGFRNALPAFEPGVERVTLRSDRHVVGDTVGYDDLERRVAYGGETFRVAGEDPSRSGS